MLHFSLNRLIYDKIIKVKIEKERHKQEETNILDSGTNMVTIKQDIKYFKLPSNLKIKENTKVYLYYLMKKTYASSGYCESKCNLHVHLELGFGGAELVEPKHVIS